jgi:predicted mannosyl-3-phosphoglycerate phosphatase (HAD superfamily)
VGYSDLSVEQLARENNMTMDEAQLATARSYDEPFRLAGSARDREQLFTAMRDAGYRCFRGVRFDHATGLLDQGHAIRLLISLYRTCAESPVVIGVGDNWTDRVLLQEVDVPIIVRNHTVDQSGLLRKVPTAYLTDRDGPAGWVEAILGSAGV